MFYTLSAAYPQDLAELFLYLKIRSRDKGTQALQGALDWSWGLLQPWAKAALSQASLFRGGFDLAAAEGVAFVRNADDNGDTLNARCIYAVDGDTPGARLWTLTVLSGGEPLQPPAEGTPVALHSRSILRFRSGDFDIRIAPLPQPGNWLYAGSSGPFALGLSLYDTSIGSDTGLTDLRMPSIKNLGCS